MCISISYKFFLFQVPDVGSGAPSPIGIKRSSGTEKTS